MKPLAFSETLLQRSSEKRYCPGADADGDGMGGLVTQVVWGEGLTGNLRENQRGGWGDVFFLLFFNGFLE